MVKFTERCVSLSLSLSLSLLEHALRDQTIAETVDSNHQVVVVPPEKVKVHFKVGVTHVEDVLQVVMKLLILDLVKLGEVLEALELIEGWLRFL